MELERKKDLSVYYWLKDLFAGTPVTVVDEYPEDKLIVPSICPEIGEIAKVPKEMGNRHGNTVRTWFIDIYAKNKTQRNEMMYKVMTELEDGIPIYNYDEGYPPTVSPTQIGCLDNSNIRSTIITVLPELVETLYWRAQVSFQGDYSET
jgi:hypothetical protein